MILDDVDSDGHIEMVVGSTDRVVRSYRFSSENTASLSERSPAVGNEPQRGGFYQLLNYHVNVCD